MQISLSLSLKQWGIALICYCFSQMVFAYSAGVISTSFVDQQRQRHLETLIFYPTEDKTATREIKTYPVFEGYHAIPDAKVAESQFPLLIITHGSGGNNTNQAFLSTILAKRGFIVVMANHPGSTTRDSVPQEGVKWWLQTEDVRFLLDSLLMDSKWGNSINQKNIGVLGHSKGGVSVLNLAGATLELTKLQHFCQMEPTDVNCEFYLNAGVDFSLIDEKRFNAVYQDERFSYFIALDPGGSTPPAYKTIFNPESLARINKPVLIVGAERFRADADFSINADYLFSLLNPHYATYFSQKEANHFSYVLSCTEFGKQIVAEEGESFICIDGERDRKAIQQELIEKIFAFIEQVSVPEQKS